MWLSRKKNYPGYENKRGDGSRCDRTFILGDCSTFRFHVSTELHTDNMKWKQVKGGESKREQFVECTNRVCRVSSEIHIGELGRLSPRERTRFPYRYTKESPERHRLRFVKTLQFKLIKNHPQKVFMEFYKVKGRKMLIRNRYSQPSTVENYEKEA